MATSKNPLTDESAALSSALFHKIPSRSSCYACRVLFKLPNKLLAARSAIELLEMPLYLTFFGVQTDGDMSEPCEIIETNVVIFCKRHKMVHGQFSFASFVSAVLILLHVKNLGDLGLSFVGILSQIA